LFRSLPCSADRSALLCTDIHPGNILASQREPWLAIDPKPYLGDPTYARCSRVDGRLTAFQPRASA
jgi:streptomycin 6-kinase